jgi:dipeptidyl aminopeptidase/acylaminoacyl peptidase
MNSLQERYALARTLAPGERERALRHGPVKPRWSEDGRYFWYASSDGPGGLKHLLVDVRTRSRQALFDAEALAAALASSSGADLLPGALALADIRYDAASATVGFLALGRRWCWREAARELTCLGEAFASHEAVSPDGRAALSLVGPNLRLRTVERPDGVALTSDGEPDWGYGDFTDFISQVAQRLSGQPRKASVLWAPDSQRFAVMRVDLRSVPQEHLLQSVPPQGRRPLLHSYRFPTPMDEQRGRSELWFIGRDGGRVRAQLDGLECHAFTHLAMNWCRWSADGRHLFVVDGSRDGRRLSLWRVDAGDGAAQLLLEETGPAVVLPAPSIGEAPVFHVLRDGRVIWWSQREGWGHLYLIEPGQEALAITQGDWQVRGILHVDEAAQRLVFVANGREPAADAYYCSAYEIGFDGRGLAQLTSERSHHEFVIDAPRGAGSMAPDGSCFVDNYSTVARPPRAVLRDRSGAVMMALEAGDAAGAWPAGMPAPEPFKVRALDGATDLWGVLYKPFGFDPAQRYPVVEVIYGAPQTAVAPKGWLPNLHASLAEQLAALGFATLIIDGPGTPYRSREFQLASYGRVESCGGLPDHVAAIRALAASRPWMDLDRVGIAGGSGGGYATARALGGHPEFYKVGVALCGNHDQSSYVAMWGERYQGLYSEAGYADQANTAVAACITGDLLLVHGDMDDNVHPAMTLRLVDALIKADRNFDMLMVPNAGHMLILLPYVRRRIWDYFVERLMGASAPRPST